MVWSGKILVVDDSSDVRGLLSLMLATSGFQVIMAEDGFRGLTIAEEERRNLIITDISMPCMGGIEMIIRLRKQPQFSKVLILIISAYGSGITGDALDAGADEAIHIPVDFNSLINHVNQLLAA